MFDDIAKRLFRGSAKRCGETRRKLGGTKLLRGTYVSGGNVIVRWPASATGYVLKSTASLTSPSWSTVGGTPMQNGGFMEMTVAIGAANAFLRLEK